MKLLNKYKNGNYLVKLYDDGTKVRLYNEDPEPITPESIDIKITDFCNAGCKYCHEMSTSKGKHSDLEIIKKALEDLPPGSELAIGGGDALSHPDIMGFLTWAKEKQIIPNMTVNSFHLRTYKEVILKLIEDKYIYGLGISYNLKYIDIYKDFNTSNTVFHLITGVHEVNDIDILIKTLGKVKVLILGYKDKGRGVEYLTDNECKVDSNIKTWHNNIDNYFNNNNILVSFDNLAIKSLNISRFFSDCMWSKLYMGDDGKFTMYIDAVNKQYTTSSTTKDRYELGDKNIIDMFNHIRGL